MRKELTRREWLVAAPGVVVVAGAAARGKSEPAGSIGVHPEFPSQDPALVREMLNVQVQEIINRLRNLRGNGDIYVAVRNYELLAVMVVVVVTCGLLGNVERSLERFAALERLPVLGGALHQVR